jgi:hypothetical protein
VSALAVRWRRWWWTRRSRKQAKSLPPGWFERPAVLGQVQIGPLPGETWDEFIARIT